MVPIVPGKAVPTKRPWFKLDVDFLVQDTIAELRADFGAAGPLTVIAIIAEAKKSDLAGQRPPRDQGILEIRATSLAHIVSSDAGTVLEIVQRAVDLGLLEHVEGSDVAAGRLRVRSLKRGPWEPRDATAAARQARRRQGEDDTDDDDDSDEIGF
jgi:hypothetical protein